MNIQIKYGKKFLEAELPQKADISIVSCMEENYTDEDKIIGEAMENPIGCGRICHQVSAREKVVIVTSDITRPFPTAKVLPFVIEELKAAGVTLKNITVIFALGSHRKHKTDEIKKMAGELYGSGINFVDSDVNNCEYLGVTSAGTPIEIDKNALNADYLICMGNIEYHYFAGYSGGAKAILPGVASRKTIQANHSMMLYDGAEAGRLDGNPVRTDIDEAGKYAGIDFIVNVILDENSRIVAAVCGDYLKAHRKGCKILDRYSAFKLKKKGDVVIIGGGYPKDINLYQGQKWLETGRRFACDDGILIWCVGAGEGFGNDVFRSWMLDKTPAEMVQDIEESFILGGHKAAAIGRVLLKHKVYCISEFDHDQLKSMGMIPCSCLQEAVDMAVRERGESAVVTVLPKARSILPILE